MSNLKIEMYGKMVDVKEIQKWFKETLDMLNSSGIPVVYKKVFHTDKEIITALASRPNDDMINVVFSLSGYEEEVEQFTEDIIDYVYLLIIGFDHDKTFSIFSKDVKLFHYWAIRDIPLDTSDFYPVDLLVKRLKKSNPSVSEVKALLSPDYTEPVKNNEDVKSKAESHVNIITSEPGKPANSLSGKELEIFEKQNMAKAIGLIKESLAILQEIQTDECKA